MTDEFTPETEPSGSLDPPRRTPPTAVGAMTPEPEPRRHAASRQHSTSGSAPSLEEALLRPVADAVRGVMREIERMFERL